MKRFFSHIGRIGTVLPVLLLLLASCAKDYMIDVDSNASYSYKDASDVTSMATGTVKSRDGVRYIQLDAVSAGYVINPDGLQGIADGTRVFLQYREVLSTNTPDFCTETILVEWISPLEMGDIRYDMQASPGDPVEIILDWITCLEDGFLTLHYSVPSKGKAAHSFSLYPGVSPYEYRLMHDANGDTEGDRTDGIVCFAVGDLLPETGEETVTLSMTYLNIDHTQKTLTVEYRSPK